MKILHLLSGGNIGGIETLCMDIARYGREEHVFCFLYAGGIIADKLEQQYHNILRLYEKQAAARIPYLIKTVKKEKYEAVLVHHEGTRIYNCYLTLQRRFPQIKFIKYLHCSFEDKYFYTGNRLIDHINHLFLEKAICKSNGCIAVSEYVKKSYQREFKQCRSRIDVIYNGISPQMIGRSAEQHLQKSAGCNLLYIGRLVDVKGVQILLQAMKLLCDRNVQVNLTILGDGPKRDGYEQLARELGIASNVQFMGFVLDKEKYYHEADVFIYPSLWEEAFGISIIEAMAYGLICVASDKGGIPEILNDKNGILVKNISSETLAGSLERAIEIYNSPERDRMIHSGKESVKRFNVVETVRHLELYCRE